jgi:hypothetical protein
MKIKIERCWVGGSDPHRIRATDPNGGRHTFRYNNQDGYWDRTLAGEIKDYFQHHYNVNRSSIRFIHLN